MYWPALPAAGCDFVGVVLLTMVYRLVAADRGWLAGVVGILSYYLSAITTTVTVTTLQARGVSRIAQLMGLIAVSTIIGTRFGQVIGQRLSPSKDG